MKRKREGEGEGDSVIIVVVMLLLSPLHALSPSSVEGACEDEVNSHRHLSRVR
jgi:hypothetical protein